jgi:hypothetical protein
MLRRSVDVERRFFDTLRSYVDLVLQTPFEIDGPVDSSILPAFLSQRYSLVAGQILRHQCVLMVPQNDAELTPATVAKHRDQLRRHFPTALVILATSRLSNHNRHRLIAQHVSFIVPGNQLFVPELALDLREHFRSEPDLPAESLSPTGQVLVLAALLERLEQDTASTLAARFHYSAMSMSRAIAELEALQLVEIEPAGKFRHFLFHLPRRELWRRTRGMLRSPVRKRRRIRRPGGDTDLPLAGESALAERTDLSHPRIEVRAIAASDWKAFARRNDLDEPLHWDDPAIELETWSYDPLLLGDRGEVDPISLWLSLPDSADERVGAAKDRLLEQVGL